MATDTVQHSTALVPLSHAFLPPWEVFCRARVAGKTQREAWIEAHPDRVAGLSFSTQRQNGSDLDRRPEVQARIAELRGEAMEEAKHSGADLVRSLATEIADARTIEDAEAVKQHLDTLDADACDAGVAGLKVRSAVCMCRVKLIEVLGRIRLQALGHLTRYASRAAFTGASGDAPVSVSIDFGGSRPGAVVIEGRRGDGEAERVEVQPPVAEEAQDAAE